MRQKFLFTLIVVLVMTAGGWAQTAAKIAILYDSFGKSASLIQDWGYAALVEYGGKKILFDSGNDPETFAKNLHMMGIDLRKVDFAVISHRHGDHTSGLTYLLKVNPKIRIYVPHEPFGLFGGDSPQNLYRDIEELPKEYRYFNGTHRKFKTGTPWTAANFVQVDSNQEIVPGIILIHTISQTPGTLELHELTLRLETPSGAIVVSGCSHAGIHNILQAADDFKHGHVRAVVGGLHLVKASDDDIRRIVSNLKDHWRLDEIAPGHCTGEPAMAILRKEFQTHLRYAGLGEVLWFQ
jgi:Metal-dependent hydrolases of the beta-lactamase superfamily II